MDEYDMVKKSSQLFAAHCDEVFGGSHYTMIGYKYGFDENGRQYATFYAGSCSKGKNCEKTYYPEDL